VASKVVETRAAGYAAGYNVLGDPRPAVTNYVTTHQISEGTYPSLALLIRDIAKQIQSYGSLAKIPAATVGNTRNDMYLASEATRFLQKDKESDLSKADIATLGTYKKGLDGATKFHSRLGEGFGRARTRARNNDRLEAHLRHRRPLNKFVRATFLTICTVLCLLAFKSGR
jgi:hypothetical protein